MPTLKLTDQDWYTHQAARVLDALHAHLPHAGITLTRAKAYLTSAGFDFTDEEWQEIATRLITAGNIEIIP